MSRICCLAAAACFVASWFLNPPYPFPLEDNLAYADFIRLHQQGAQFLASLSEGSSREQGSSPRILTAWRAVPRADPVRRIFIHLDRLTPPAYFARYGPWTVFAARFFAGLRVVAAPCAGAAGMHWPRFFLANAAGAVAWATAVSLLGYYFGRNWGLLHHWLNWGVWIVLGGLLVALVTRHLWRRRTGAS